MTYQATVRQAVTKLAALTEERVRKESHLAGKLAAFISVRIAFWKGMRAYAERHLVPNPFR